MSDHNPCLRVRTQAAIRWLGTLAPLAALAAGCIFFVPVPTAHHSEGSRRNLTEDTATRFVPGGATVDDVVLAWANRTKPQPTHPGSRIGGNGFTCTFSGVGPSPQPMPPSGRVGKGLPLTRTR